jgi:3-methyladenine DNA glycosylase AlkD
VNVSATIAALRRRLRALGTPGRAVAEKAYLKSALSFHGVTVPQVRSAAADLLWAHPDLERAELPALVDGLYRTRFHDLRSAGIAVLEKKQALLSPADLPWLAELVGRSANWAHVDWLSTKVIGPVIARTASRRRILRAWAADGDFWVRRTALLAQHDELRAGRGDFDLFAEIAAPMLPEKEFFIRKAIGWVLREVSRRRPALTVTFLRRHGAIASGLTLREATRHLPAGVRADLYSAHGSSQRGARPAGGRLRPAGGAAGGPRTGRTSPRRR